METSRLPGFHKLGRKGRIQKLGLSKKDVKTVEDGLSLEQAEHMIENVIGAIKIPLGVATNFLVDGKDYLVPMAIEEPSVVAAASNAAKIARVRGGFKAEATKPVMRGEIQLLDFRPGTEKTILDSKKEILNLANEQDRVLVKFGGGAVDLKIKTFKTKRKDMLVVYLLVDVRDAMGANAVNTMCEAVSEHITEKTGCRACLKIVSNYATERMVKATAVFDGKALGGQEVVESVLDAQELALNDVYRAVTHNKGVMNGIDAIAIATGNDFRAIEAGAHAYAARKGYKPLTNYSKDKEGNLVGEIELPLAVGIIGGATKTNPTAKTALKILGVKTASELAKVMASVGLAQNLAALKALATEGIQKGHMKLHARNIAVTAGAKGKQVDEVAEQLVVEENIKVERAVELLK